MAIRMAEEFNHDALNYESVRPIGMWRFLTPLETPQKGDLFRVIAGAVAHELSPYMNNWTVEENTGDRPMSQLMDYEYMRQVDDSSGYVPMFERTNNG